MNIKHRISVTLDHRLERLIRLADLSLDSGPAGKYLCGDSITFVISESSPAWGVMNEYLCSVNHVDVVTTEYSPKELAEAPLLEMIPEWHFGYPQPEGKFGYKSITYDARLGCRTCGIGLVQVSPFRMRKPPLWKGRHIFQLNWVFDEWFVQPDYWRGILRPFGVECIPVLDTAGKRELADVVQLKLTALTQAPIEFDSSAQSEQCTQCGCRKHHAQVRGRFPHCELPVKTPIGRTRDYFGSGGSAWRGTVVRDALFQAMDATKVKGVRFAPVAQR